SGTDGRVEFWNIYGGDLKTLTSSQWRLWTDIEVRISEDRIIIKTNDGKTWDYVPPNWWEAAHAGELQFTAYYVKLSQALASPGESGSDHSDTNSGGDATVTSNIDKIPFSRIGRFAFQVCHDDLRPTAETLSDQLSDLELGAPYQSTALEGMMYVERNGSS